jgi:hypothetical protein
MAVKTHSTELRIGTAAAGTVVAKLTSIKAPGVTIETEDVTTHDQAHNFRQHIPTIAEYGEIEVEGNLVAANTLALTGKIMAAPEAWSIKFPQFATPITFDFSGFLTSFEPAAAPIAGKLSFTARIKVTGNVTYGGLS